MSDNKKNTNPQEKETTIMFGDGKVFKVGPDIKTIPLEGGKMAQLENGHTIHFEIGKTVQIRTEEKPLPREVKTVEPKKVVVTGGNGHVINIPGEGDMQLREENVQEILTAVPRWMIRWGNTLFCGLILLLLFVSWFVKYPEVVSTQVTVINKFPSQKIFYTSTSPISEILVSKGDPVHQGEVLAVRQNNASYQDILLLQSLLDTITVNSKSFYFPFHQLPALTLGDIQAPFAQFEDSYLLYKRNQKNIERVKQQIYEPTGSVSDAQSIDDVQQFQQVIKDFQDLKTRVDQWDQKYLIKSVIEGEVQSIDNNPTAKDALMVIKPLHPPLYVAQLQVPLLNSGKVKPDQTVLLKLNNYPEMEFGMLEGIISPTKGPAMENGNAYLLEAFLPRQLVTSYNKEIDFQDNLQGTADIIVEHSRLLQRFFNRVH